MEIEEKAIRIIKNSQEGEYDSNLSKSDLTVITKKSAILGRDKKVYILQPEYAKQVCLRERVKFYISTLLRFDSIKSQNPNRDKEEAREVSTLVSMLSKCEKVLHQKLDDEEFNKTLYKTVRLVKDNVRLYRMPELVVYIKNELQNRTYIEKVKPLSKIDKNQLVQIYCELNQKLNSKQTINEDNNKNIDVNKEQEK